eukprot:GHVN01035394.1.p1 GENE.GHVN01035394.1~~GHVN01035394.1.p1  ORF type:complete len:1811 (+),score=207.81 GHVN01035394.1:2671-8103(+)
MKQLEPFEPRNPGISSIAVSTSTVQDGARSLPGGGINYPLVAAAQTGRLAPQHIGAASVVLPRLPIQSTYDKQLRGSQNAAAPNVFCPKCQLKEFESNAPLLHDGRQGKGVGYISSRELLLPNSWHSQGALSQSVSDTPSSPASSVSSVSTTPLRLPGLRSVGRDCLPVNQTAPSGRLITVSGSSGNGGDHAGTCCVKSTQSTESPSHKRGFHALHQETLNRYNSVKLGTSPSSSTGERSLSKDVDQEAVLLGVVCVMRHGARTPKEFPYADSDVEMTVKETKLSKEKKEKKEKERRDSARFFSEGEKGLYGDPNTWPFALRPGQLTDKGWNQALWMGHQLFSQYGSALSLSKELRRPRPLILSTSSGRCEATAAGVLLGMLLSEGKIPNITVGLLLSGTLQRDNTLLIREPRLERPEPQRKSLCGGPIFSYFLSGSGTTTTLINQRHAALQQEHGLKILRRALDSIDAYHPPDDDDDEPSIIIHRHRFAILFWGSLLGDFVGPMALISASAVSRSFYLATKTHSFASCVLSQVEKNPLELVEVVQLIRQLISPIIRFDDYSQASFNKTRLFKKAITHPSRVLLNPCTNPSRLSKLLHINPHVTDAAAKLVSAVPYLVGVCPEGTPLSYVLKTKAWRAKHLKNRKDRILAMSEEYAAECENYKNSIEGVKKLTGWNSEGLKVMKKFVSIYGSFLFHGERLPFDSEINDEELAEIFKGHDKLIRLQYGEPDHNQPASSHRGEIPSKSTDRGGSFEVVATSGLVPNHSCLGGNSGPFDESSSPKAQPELPVAKEGSKKVCDEEIGGLRSKDECEKGEFGWRSGGATLLEIVARLKMLAQQHRKKQMGLDKSDRDETDNVDSPTLPPTSSDGGLVEQRREPSHAPARARLSPRLSMRSGGHLVECAPYRPIPSPPSSQSGTPQTIYTPQPRTVPQGGNYPSFHVPATTTPPPKTAATLPPPFTKPRSSTNAMPPPRFTLFVTHKSGLLALQSALRVEHQHIAVPEYASFIIAELYYTPKQSSKVYPTSLSSWSTSASTSAPSVSSSATSCSLSATLPASPITDSTCLKQLPVLATKPPSASRSLYSTTHQVQPVTHQRRLANRRHHPPQSKVCPTASQSTSQAPNSQRAAGKSFGHLKSNGSPCSTTRADLPRSTSLLSSHPTTLSFALVRRRAFSCPTQPASYRLSRPLGSPLLTNVSDSPHAFRDYRSHKARSCEIQERPFKRFVAPQADQGNILQPSDQATQFQATHRNSSQRDSKSEVTTAKTVNSEHSTTVCQPSHHSANFTSPPTEHPSYPSWSNAVHQRSLSTEEFEVMKVTFGEKGQPFGGGHCGYRPNLDQRRTSSAGLMSRGPPFVTHQSLEVFVESGSNQKNIERLTHWTDALHQSLGPTTTMAPNDPSRSHQRRPDHPCRAATHESGNRTSRVSGMRDSEADESLTLSAVNEAPASFDRSSKQRSNSYTAPPQLRFRRAQMLMGLVEAEVVGSSQPKKRQTRKPRKSRGYLSDGEDNDKEVLEKASAHEQLCESDGLGMDSYVIRWYVDGMKPLFLSQNIRGPSSAASVKSEKGDASFTSPLKPTSPMKCETCGEHVSLVSCTGLATHSLDGAIVKDRAVATSEKSSPPAATSAIENFSTRQSVPSLSPRDSVSNSGEGESAEVIKFRGMAESAGKQFVPREMSSCFTATVSPPTKGSDGEGLKIGSEQPFPDRMAFNKIVSMGSKARALEPIKRRDDWCPPLKRGIVDAGWIDSLFEKEMGGWIDQGMTGEREIRADSERLDQCRSFQPEEREGDMPNEVTVLSLQTHIKQNIVKHGPPC